MKCATQKCVNIILVLFSCLIAIALFEVVLRIYLSASDQAVHMMSSPSMIQSPDGIVKYSRNTSIRSVATDESGIVYDVLFDTNDFGFVDNVDYTNLRKNRNIALLGDSFTAGYHGGTPWISGLRRNLDPAAAVFNLGVSGTGIREFEKRLNNFAASVPIDEVYILVISNDFYRRLWYPASNGGELWFCSHEDSKNECLSAKPPTFYSVDLQSSSDEALAKADEIRARLPSKGHGFAIYRMFKDILWKIQDSDMSKRLANADVQASLEAIVRISDQFGSDRVFILHLPMKNELGGVRYDLDLSEFAASHNINYIPTQKMCPLTKSMFFERDNHPNAIGYKHIAECVAGLITSRSVFQ